MATAVGLLQLAAGDPTATRRVYAIVVALGVIGVLLVVLAVWLIRSTRPDRELLAPLELMGDRRWRSQDPAQMRRALDDVRPPGAEPVVRQPGRPDLDEEFEQPVPALARFDDLRDAPQPADADSAADGVGRDGDDDE